MLPGQQFETRSLQMVEGRSRHAYTVTFLVKEKPAEKQMDDNKEMCAGGQFLPAEGNESL